METEVYEFSTSIFIWIKGIIEITRRDIMICYPNTILWLIPNGRSKDIVPLRNVSGVSIERYTIGWKMVLGATLVIFGTLALVIVGMMPFVGDSSTLDWGRFFSVFLKIIFFVAVPGVLLFLASMRRTLVILCCGDEYDIDVPFFEAKKLFDIQNCINVALDYEADKYDMNLRKADLAEEIGDAVGQAMKRYKD